MQRTEEEAGQGGRQKGGQDQNEKPGMCKGPETVYGMDHERDTQPPVTRTQAQEWRVGPRLPGKADLGPGGLLLYPGGGWTPFTPTLESALTQRWAQELLHG